MTERTLVLVKPDAVDRGLIGVVVARFQRRGLSLRAAKLLVPGLRLAEEHYCQLRPIKKSREAA